MRRTLIPVLIASLVGAVALGTPASQAANPKQPPKTATFKASLKGEQTITWSYNRSPQAPCYGGENAGGSARMFYESVKPAKVTAYQITKDNPLWETLYRRVMFTPNFTIPTSVTMEGEHAAGPVPSPDECDDNGGGVEPQPTDCATGDALLDIELFSVAKNRLTLTGNASSWDPGFEELRNLFGNCPYWQGGPYTRQQAEGDLTPIAVPVKHKQLFDRKGPKKLVLNGGIEDCYDDELVPCGEDYEEGPFRGKIVTAWKLTLKRVK